MNSTDLIKYLNEYFNYIKTIFLKDYSKYLAQEKKEKIEQMSDVFKIDESSKFKIFISDKINVCTNIDEFIIDNNLNNDVDLKDISINGKIYVKYLKDNKKNEYKVVLESIIPTIITYFIGKVKTVIEKGTIDLVVDEIVNNYNLKNVRPYESKEKEIADKIIKIVHRDILLKSVFNNDINLLKNKYIEYTTEQINLINFDDLNIELEKEYNYYYKRIGRVYYSDSLYDYENINYTSILKELEKIDSINNNNSNSKMSRINSIKKSIQNIKKYNQIFDAHEQFLINNCSIEIDNILSKIDLQNIDEQFEKSKKIENILLPISLKIWNQMLSSPMTYNTNSFMFLVGDYKNSEYVETRLISKEQLVGTNSNIKPVGFIFKINNNLVYSSTKNFLYTENNDGKIEIDDISDSYLQTPQMIINSNLETKTLTGKIILKNAEPIGIYAICDSELSSDYVKAVVLSEKYELPLVILSNIKNKTIEKSEITIPKKEIKQINKKKSLKERLKNFNHKMIYDEEIEDFKKVL